MKTNNSPIQLNEPSPPRQWCDQHQDIVAERHVARAMRIAGECLQPPPSRAGEAADPFGLNWCR